MKKCPNCAKEIQNNTKYCRFCKKKVKKGSGGFWFLVFIAIVGYLGWNSGQFDEYFNEYNSFDSVENTTCRDLQESAIGVELSNTIGNTWEVRGVRNSKEVSRSKSKLVCAGELMFDGVGNQLRIELSDVDNKLWVRYKVVNGLSNTSVEQLKDLENLGN